MISVIIPVFNRPQALKLALDSVYKQTYKDIEIIIVDDGSEPPVASRHCEEPKGDVAIPLSLEEHTSYNNSNLPIQLVRQENKGAPAARNRGFGLSKGDYVIFWDADVVGEPNMLERMHEALESHPETSYSYSDHYLGSRKMPSMPFDPDKLKEINYITTMSLIRRKDFPGFDESLKKFQDWDLWLTMLEKEKFGFYIPEFLFLALPGGTMSTWLPSLSYKAPWRWLPYIRREVNKYFKAREIVLRKHGLFSER